MRPYQQKLQRRKRLSKKHLLIVLGVALLVLATVAVLELTNRTYFFHEKSLVSAPNKPNRTQNADTKGENADSSNKNNKNADQKNQTTEPGHETKDKNSSPSNSTTPPKTPSGTFVSNHRPNLSGKPAPNEIQSTCETTSGASCQILFTKDGVTKFLPTQPTDRGGAAYWTWKLQDIGLTAGSWKVTAKATLGSQTATADDATNLEVSP